jgi:hypothetical protein
MPTANLEPAPTGFIHAWLFEAKGIQRWLFSSGRLRDIVGGSDLVSHIAMSKGSDLLARAIDECGLAVVDRVDLVPVRHNVSLSRRAGGAFYVHGNDRDTLVTLRRSFLKRFLVALPGLEYQDVFGQGADEIASRDNAFAVRGASRRNALASVLPLGRPVFAINPRSGLPQSEFVAYGYGDERETVPLDRVLAPQRRRADALQERFAAGVKDLSNRTRFLVDGAAKRFHSRTTAEGVFVYPRNLADDEEDKLHNPLFPWIEGSPDRRVALVHADISALGQLFQNASVGSAMEARKLAEAIEEAILLAVGKAADEVLLPAATGHVGWGMIVPARPLVVGGDDITVLVRADLAVPFAVALLRHIEQTTKGISGGLSACAGVAIASRSQPFLALNTLAESLCAFAKAKAKSQPRADNGTWPSLMAFHVHSQSAEEGYAADIHPHLCLPDRHSLTANPFAINETGSRATGCTTWDRLADLAASIVSVRGADGAFREIGSELAKGPERLDNVNARWRRFWTRAGLEQLSKAMAEAASLDETTIRDAVPEAGQLFDALELIDLKTPLPTAESGSPKAATAQEVA